MTATNIVSSGLPGWLQWHWAVASVLKAYARKFGFPLRGDGNSLPRRMTADLSCVTKLWSQNEEADGGAGVQSHWLLSVTQKRELTSGDGVAVAVVIGCQNCQHPL